VSGRADQHVCNYCGCRDFPLIGRLSAEHEEIANARTRTEAAALASAVGEP
jgi:hypothetical protein